MSEQPFLSRRAVLATLASAAAPGIALAAPIDAQRVRAQLAEKWTDVDSALVLSGGVPTFEFYRDGQPDRARLQFSVGKSVLSALVGRAQADGHLRSIDERVLDIVPEWAKENADERLRSMTIGHLLTMTAGFAVNDPTGTARAEPIPGPWRRPMAAAPGERFAYDNGAFALLAAALERAVKMPLADYARAALAQPLGLAEPDLRSGLAMRTCDMARIGQLYLQEGEWEGRQLLAREYVAASTRAQNAGGRPAMLGYGYMWWILPGPPGRQPFMASGWGGQTIRVDPARQQVIAITCPASFGSQQRRHWLELMVALL